MDLTRILREWLAVALYVSTPFFTLWWIFWKENLLLAALHLWVVPYFAKSWVLPPE